MSHLPSDTTVGSEEAEGWNGRRVLRSSKFGTTQTSVIRGDGGRGVQVSLATHDAEGVHVAREYRARWSRVPPQLPSASTTTLCHLNRWADAVDEREAESSAPSVINQMLSRTTASNASLRQLVANIYAPPTRQAHGDE